MRYALSSWGITRPQVGSRGLAPPTLPGYATESSSVRVGSTQMKGGKTGAFIIFKAI